MGFRKNLGLIGLAMASLMAGLQSSRTVSANRGVTIDNAKDSGTSRVRGQHSPVNNNKTAAAQQINQKFHPKGKISPRYFAMGVPPRQWGEYLQRRGKQKWDKRKA